MKLSYLLSEQKDYINGPGCLLLDTDYMRILVNLPLIHRHPLGQIDVHFHLPDHLLPLARSHTQAHIKVGVSSNVLYSVDCIVITEALGMLGLPFLTRLPGFHARIFACDAVVESARLLIEQWLSCADDHAVPSASFTPQNDEVLGLHELYSRTDARACLARVETVRFAQVVEIGLDSSARAFCSGYAPGSANWMFDLMGRRVFVLADSSTESDRLNEGFTIGDHLPAVDLLISAGRLRSFASGRDVFVKSLDAIGALVQQSMAEMSSIIVCLPANHLMFDVMTFLLNKRQSLLRGRHFVAYTDIRDFIRRFPSLTEWLKLVNEGQQPVIDIVRPGFIADLSLLERQFKAFPAVIFASEVDACGSDYLEFLMDHLASIDRPVRRIVIALDSPVRMRELQGKMAACGHPLAISLVDGDPVLGHDDWVSIVRGPLKARIVALPEYYISESMISPSLVSKWDKEFAGQQLVIYPSSTSSKGALVACDLTPYLYISEHGSIRSQVTVTAYKQLLAHAVKNAGTVDSIVKAKIVPSDSSHILYHLDIVSLSGYPTTDWHGHVEESLARSNLSWSSTADENSMVRISVESSTFGTFRISFTADGYPRIEAATYEDCIGISRYILQL
eukprot:Partr_v1_DN27051_c1_g1_i1_m29289